MRYFTLSVVLLLSGCGDVDRALDEVAKLREEVKQTREAAKTIAEAGIRAVPGERYLQLIDGINSSDPEKKAEAKRFLTSLMHGVEEATEYEATVSFGFDATKPFHADLFRQISDSQVHVDNYIAAKAFNPNQQVNNTLALPMTQTELNALLDKNLKELMDDIGGTAEYSYIPIPPQNTMLGNPGAAIEAGVLSWSGSIAPVKVALIPQQVQDRSGWHSAGHPFFETQSTGAAQQAANAKRQDAADLLKKIVLSQYQTRSVSTLSGLSVDWPLNDLRNFLFILIPEADFEAHKKDRNFAIEVSIHSKSDATRTLHRKGPMPYYASEFEANPPLDLPVKALGRVRWAVHDPTGEGMYPPETLDHLKAAQAFLVAYDKFKTSPPSTPETKKHWWQSSK